MRPIEGCWVTVEARRRAGCPKASGAAVRGSFWRGDRESREGTEDRTGATSMGERLPYEVLRHVQARRGRSDC